MSLIINALLSGCIKEASSSRVIRLKMSIGQYIVYAIYKIKTPKSITHPTVIKSLTNCIDYFKQLTRTWCQQINP